MNRWDEIQGAARDVADWACADPADRNRMADELIRLVTLVVGGVGKGVAVAGESAMNGPDSEADAGGERYLVGEDIQRAAEEVREQATGADIERYERDGLTPVWRPDPGKRALAQRLAIASSFPPVPDPFTGPAPFTAGPFAPGELTRLAHETADAMREQHKTPVPVQCPPGTSTYCDDQNCPAHGDAGRIGMCVRDGAEHRWVTATDGDTGEPLGYVHCGVCGQPRCPWIPGDATPSCDHSSGCTTHGLPSARKCPGARVYELPPNCYIQHIHTPECDAAAATVLHQWVTATDEGAPSVRTWNGQLEQALDHAFCGSCGVRKCDGGCGDPSVGATPDIDCPTHGNDRARQCVERCVGCGDPVDNGRAHGLNQGFGGCV